MKAYTDSFFNEQKQKSVRQAQLIVPIILKFIKPKNIVDVGCGIGHWVRAFKENGIDGVGFDGSWVPKEKILIDTFNEIDLAKELPKVKADLVLCLEVAEHLPPSRAEGFIEDLTAMSTIIVFSAAVPGQGGVHHINEQWQSYWVDLFKQQGYVIIDCLRPLLWNNKDVELWYKQNMFFFVRKDVLQLYPKLKHESHNKHPIDVAHPDMIKNIDPKSVSLKKALEISFSIFKIMRRQNKNER